MYSYGFHEILKNILFTEHRIFLVCIFPHLEQKKLRNWTLFTHCVWISLYSIFHRAWRYLVFLTYSLYLRIPFRKICQKTDHRKPIFWYSLRASRFQRYHGTQEYSKKLGILLEFCGQSHRTLSNIYDGAKIVKGKKL